MVKRFTFVLFVLMLLPTLIFAQNMQLKVQHKKIVDENQVPTSVNAGVRLFDYSALTVAGEPIGVASDYDYFSNSIIRDQIVYDETMQTPHFANMIRPYDMDNPGTRYVIHTYSDGTNWVHLPVKEGQAGWPQIDLSLTGSAAGTIGIVYHAPPALALWDGSTGYITSEFDPDSDPSLQFSGDNIFLATSGNRVQFQFYKTDDFGVSYTNWDSISSYSPSPIYWFENGGVEVGMSKSPDEQNLIMFGTNGGVGGSGAHVYDGIDPDSCDNAWAIYSTDGGTSWTGKTIGIDGVIDLISGYHTPYFAPLFENFGQLDMAVGNDGVMHAVANGYGLAFNSTGDTAVANSYPVLYWNSTTDAWISISDEAIDTVQSIGDYYPGNNIGQCYPSIAVSEDGKYVYSVWTGPQFTSGVLDTSNGLYMTDLYHASSTDGGATWTYLGTLSNDPLISEAYGTVAQHLRMDGNDVVADIVYMADQSAGVNVFDEGEATVNDIMYATYVVATVDDVNDPNGTVNSFELKQNYPNPFNPSTTIDYSISERANVLIKVYDMLGREVSTLVNSVQEVGTHQVNFDATNLVSGMYVYTIQAGEFTSSKKMLLLK